MGVALGFVVAFDDEFRTWRGAQARQQRLNAI